MSSFILIRPTVCPQCTNVTDRTDRQTGQDRQRTDSIGRSVLQTVAQNLPFAAIPHNLEISIKTPTNIKILTQDQRRPRRSLEAMGDVLWHDLSGTVQSKSIPVDI